MKRLISGLLLFFLAINIVLVPSEMASANINTKINEMFQKFGMGSAMNVTGPGAYMAQTRGMITGGSLNFRTMQDDIPSLYHVKPPKFNFGCGGVDIFFGGIDFVNLQEMVQMLKNIGAGAISYAFGIALESVCPTCMAVIKDLANKANALLGKLKNSCYYSSMLVSEAGLDKQAKSNVGACMTYLQSDDYPLGKKTPAEAQSICQNTLSASSNIAMWSDQEQAKGNVKPTTPSPGIWPYDQLNALTEDDKIIAMSFVGAIVTSCDEATGSSGNLPITTWEPATLTLKDVMYGNKKATVLRPSGKCKVERSEMEIEGFHSKVRDQLESIHKKLSGVNSAKLTAEEINFINSSVVPVHSLLNITTSMPGLSRTVMDLVEDVIVVSMAYDVVRRYMRIAQMTIGKQKVTNDAQAIERIESAKDELWREMKRELDIFNTRFRSFEVAMFFQKQVGEKVSPQLAKLIGAKGQGEHNTSSSGK